MRITKLFTHRRWMLWLPVPVVVLASDSITEFGKLMVGGMIFFLPYYLAWWLSDGFKGMSQWPGCGAPDITGGINPATGKFCEVHHLPWGDVHVGGN